MKNDLKIWCILIPTLKAKEAKNPFFRKRHHKVWDNFVRDITGGLTIFATGKGQWVNDENEVVEERVIPVNIACTDKQLKSIIEFTIKHYDQDALMYYKVSDEVFLIKRDK
jgi:hypothetical protein